MAYRRGRERRRYARGDAGEHARRKLPDDLLLVFPDVLVNVGVLHDGSLAGHPARVELPEVDRRGDDDRPAGDGRDGARQLRAARTRLRADGDAQADRAPDDDEAAQERHAPADEVDDVRKHVMPPP